MAATKKKRSRKSKAEVTPDPEQDEEIEDDEEDEDAEAAPIGTELAALDASAKQAMGDLSEPSAADLAAEEARIEEEESPKAKNRPSAGKDLLASYMDQLSRIPLFAPEQELENARKLEEQELHALRLILGTPKAVQHMIVESTDLDEELRAGIEKLLQSYRKAAGRTRKHTLPERPARNKLIEEIAKSFRTGDFDKVVLDRVMHRVRREVWGRRVMDASPAFRLTHAQLTEIEKARGAALRTRNNFVRANLRLVVSVARNFHHYRIPFIDLIQEGNVGLMKAVHRFDHKRGFRFSTYAHWWIRQSIERAIINKGSQVRLPVHVIDSRRQVSRAVAKLTQEFDRAPTLEELSKHLNLPAAKIEQIQNGVQQDPVSLDESIGSDDPRKFLDLVRDNNDPPIDEALIRENTHDRLRELLQKLNPIEKDIIRRRFGLGDDSDQTLDEIGKIYNLSRERVRQIQAQGLQKMRRMCERRKIS